MQHRSYRFEVRASGDNGEVEGYGSVFNNTDAYGDVIVKGAFGRSIMDHKAAGTMPAMLWQHDTSEPIGVWTEMTEDEAGLRVKGRLAMDTVRGREAYSLMKMGALNGLSIGFMAKEATYDRGKDLRTLTEIDLWEVSLVTFPANRLARVTNVKAADFADCKTIRDVERRMIDAGLKEHLAVAGIAAVKRVVAAERDARDLAQAQKAAERLLQTLHS
jgi:HK97 family phage prohead protease